ncbi:carbohydrate ABC transporter permease [Phreatobacter stygius]|uniref:Sugar ABC transporter permease n=1 Tax=Phreatobacter stygius TaxID=1940610 RepID=A0A4D7B7F6_9HYPH|nr:sugar ABC transporter permease [Phreatobacter stygius]QCI66823.1 sugar ABC transporter permease [Phreatobacter stygius]
MRALANNPTLRGYLFAAPLMVVLAAAVVLPALYNAVLAFWRYDAMRDNWRFVGAANFTALVDAPAFWNALSVTGIWVVGNVALQLALGLAVALALNTVTSFRALYSAVVMVPWVSSFVIVAVVFLWLYHPDLGVLNDVLTRLGLIDQPVAWLASPGLAQFSLILANTWKFFPLVAITLFTGLQAIPRELSEAATIDGAGRWQTLRYVIVPMLAPSIATAVLLSTIWAFNAFTLSIIMTGGGPLRATEVIGLYIYKVAFDSFDFGLAAAASMVLFVLILAVTLVYLRVADPARGRRG